MRRSPSLLTAAFKDANSSVRNCAFSRTQVPGATLLTNGGYESVIMSPYRADHQLHTNPTIANLWVHDLAKAESMSTAIERYNAMLDIAMFIGRNRCKHGSDRDIAKLRSMVLSNDISVRYFAASILGGLGCSSIPALGAMREALSRYGRGLNDIRVREQIITAIKTVSGDESCKALNK